ncbi:MAG: hypothetical protein IKT03_04570 [Muribaculaceae bacterium]|nr:hypothetical protein [Muribaculaceae bacterium]
MENELKGNIPKRGHTKARPYTFIDQISYPGISVRKIENGHFWYYCIIIK